MQCNKHWNSRHYSNDSGPANYVALHLGVSFLWAQNNGLSYVNHFFSMWPSHGSLNLLYIFNGETSNACIFEPWKDGTNSGTYWHWNGKRLSPASVQVKLVFSWTSLLWGWFMGLWRWYSAFWLVSISRVEYICCSSNKKSARKYYKIPDILCIIYASCGCLFTECVVLWLVRLHYQ